MFFLSVERSHTPATGILNRLGEVSSESMFLVGVTVGTALTRGR